MLKHSPDRLFIIKLQSFPKILNRIIFHYHFVFVSFFFLEHMFLESNSELVNTHTKIVMEKQKKKLTYKHTYSNGYFKPCVKT